jgi:UDPglucose 6-dehydrogenase
MYMHVARGQGDENRNRRTELCCIVQRCVIGTKNQVIATNISQARVNAVNARLSPIVDAELEDFLKNKSLNLSATTDPQEVYSSADFVIVAITT